MHSSIATSSRSITCPYFLDTIALEFSPLFSFYAHSRNQVVENQAELHIFIFPKPAMASRRRCRWTPAVPPAGFEVPEGWLYVSEVNRNGSVVKVSVLFMFGGTSSVQNFLRAKRMSL